ncbi:RNase H domain-containing protein [Trichonephila clavipes]|nr:RNase H domain-containing protein [Trichonephila clavipes]
MYPPVDPCQVDIEGNEMANSLVNEARTLEPLTVFDANAGMKILPDGSRSCVECSHCPGTQLHPKHLFSYPSIVGALFKIDNDCSTYILYSDRAIDVGTAVIHVFGNIS